MKRQVLQRRAFWLFFIFLSLELWAAVRGLLFVQLVFCLRPPRTAHGVIRAAGCGPDQFGQLRTLAQLVIETVSLYPRDLSRTGSRPPPKK